MSDTLAKLASADLGAIRPHLALADAPAALIAATPSVPEAFAALEANGFLLEAAKLLGHALPKRQAVWWACMCALHTAPDTLPESHRKVREASEAWVRQQTDPVRRSAMSMAESIGFETPESWTAIAAFWSGDSMTPADQPKLPPPAHLTGVAVAGVIGLSAVRGDPKRQTARVQRFLESGRNIAAGGPGRLTPEDA